MKATQIKRKCDIWVSNNKVLVGNGKKTHARNPNFDTEETKLLISLWGDPNIQKTLITTHKKSPVIEKLAQSMRERGYYRTPEEINTRIKNLKCLYNRYKKDLDLGVLTEPTWKHYQAMHEILNRPIFGRSAAQERMRQHELKQKELEAQRTKEKEQSDDVHSINDDDDDDMYDDDGEDDDDDDDDEDDDGMDDDDDDYFDEDIMGDLTVNFDDEDKKDGSILSSLLPVIAKAMNAKADDLGKPELAPHEIKIEEPFIIPKEEPIDVDEFECSSQKNDGLITEQITKRGLQFKITSLSSPPITTSSQTITTIPSTVAAAMRMTTSSYITMPTSSAPSQAGKISVVPTNILLKQQPQQQNIIFNSSASILRPQLFQTQANFISSSTQQQNQIQMPMQAGTNQNMPMKVLFVNRMPAATVTNPEPPKVTAPPIVTIAKTPEPPPPQTPTSSSKRPRLLDITKKASTNWRHASSKSTPGFRNLLQSLVQIQTQNLDVSRKRLEVEKQRLEFEKTALDRILAALPLLTNSKPE